MLYTPHPTRSISALHRVEVASGTGHAERLHRWRLICSCSWPGAVRVPQVQLLARCPARRSSPVCTLFRFLDRGCGWSAGQESSRTRTSAASPRTDARRGHPPAAPACARSPPRKKPKRFSMAFSSARSKSAGVPEHRRDEVSRGDVGGLVGRAELLGDRTCRSGHRQLGAPDIDGTQQDLPTAGGVGIGGLPTGGLLLAV